MKKIHLSKIKIKNYKAIDNLELEFPESADDNIYAIGSENGVGKTSVLDCIAEISAEILSGNNFIKINNDNYDNRSKCRYNILSYEIEGEFFLGNEKLKVTSEGGNLLRKDNADKLKQLGYTGRYHAKIENENMIIGNKFLYFKCNRKIYAGKVPISIGIRDIGEEDSGENEINIPLLVKVTKDNPKGELKQLHITKNISGSAEPRYRNEKVANDILKNNIVWSLLKSTFSNIIENTDKDAQEVYEKINKLLERFAQVKIETSEFKYVPIDHVNLFVCDIKNERNRFPLDELSSGQKEIISTLFLIWYYSRNENCIVLIDEPELHLNMSWQFTFIRMLREIAPLNQYILATHSEAIFRCVPREHRILLKNNEY